MRKCSIGQGDNHDAPGLNTQLISPCWCLLIWKRLMALISLSGWEVTASKHEHSQSNFTASPVGKKIPRGWWEARKERGVGERWSFEEGSRAQSNSVPLPHTTSSNLWTLREKCILHYSQTWLSGYTLFLHIHVGVVTYFFILSLHHTYFSGNLAVVSWT